MLREETYEFAAELDRLQERYHALAADAAEYAAGSAERALLRQQAEEIRERARGVRWAREAHDDDACPAWDSAADSVTLGGLTGGQYARIEDDLAAEAAGEGRWRIETIAAGTVAAPYLPPDDQGQGGTASDDAVAAVGALPKAYQQWAYARIDDLSTVGEGNWQPFGVAVAAQGEDPDETEPEPTTDSAPASPE